MAIQWFPGHMAKAKREVEENKKLVDFVIELVDARAPLSSQNPMLKDVLQDKPKVMVLMKKDMADDQTTRQWVTYFQHQGHYVTAINVGDKQAIDQVVQLAKQVTRPKINQLINKGIKPRAMRALIIGVPNVGKSTLINRLANKKIAKIGDEPGITQKQTWIKVKNEFELLDTPGILWPKFEEEIVGYRLAAIGTIKDTILPLQDVAAFVIEYMAAHYPEALTSRFNLTADTNDMDAVFEAIGKQRGALESGGVIDYVKVTDIILREFRTGKLGRITLETPPD